MRKMLTVSGIFISCLCTAQPGGNRYTEHPDSIATHRVVLDSQSKIISWIRPRTRAYDQFLRDRWEFIFRGIPVSPGPAPRSDYPQYYFYCAYKDQQMIPDTWMNDVGEKIPNWFESARLFYQYTGDKRAMDIVTRLISYTLAHGTTDSSFAWPYFPYTTTNAGDTVFRGFTDNKKFVQDELQVDHAGDIGFTYYKMYLYTGNEIFKRAAIHVADVLAAHARVGNAHQSVWPYRVVSKDGRVTAPYAANWMGCYSLLEHLVRAKLGHVEAYRSAMIKVAHFMFQFPLKTGYWTDGHTDTDVNSETYKSNMSASNFTLYLLDHPEFDSGYKKDIPGLIKWTEINFVFHCQPGEPPQQWGANIVGEQDGFLPKMDYQTARYGAECARWYAVSGDPVYKEKAFRSLNWVTYCSDSNGMAFESPLSKGVTSWWSDCYGEGPRMFYHALAVMPEWAPPLEDHILYSKDVLREVQYGKNHLAYFSPEPDGVEYIKLSFKPSKVRVNGKLIPAMNQKLKGSYLLKRIDQGDYYLVVSRASAGPVSID